jgi:hypothetical protein
MKKVLLFLITMLSVALLYAQTNENNSTNENIFNQAELVFEGNYQGIVAAYNPNNNFDDGHRIEVYKVKTVYKGDQSLTNGTVYIIKKGGNIGIEKLEFSKYENFDKIEWVGYTPPQLYEKGIRNVTPVSPRILFLKNSNDPDDITSNYSEETSNYANQKKYILIDELYVWNNISAGINGLAFSNSSELHNWMKQFEGYAFPDWKPGLNWVNGNEQDTSILDTEYYENLKIIMDSINNEIIIEVEKDKKKEQENPDKSLVNKTLTLYINNPVKVQEGSKYYLKFDVMVKSNAPETYLAETAFSIKYNTSIFGSLPLNKINYTIGDQFNISGSNYIAMLFSLGSDNFSFNFGDNTFFPNPTATKVQLHTTPVTLLHIKIELLGNVTIPASPVSFFVSELNNVSKYTLSSAAPTSYYYFKTYCKSNNPPAITSISPTSRFAGVGEILTINGSNFGTTPGKIHFRAADNGGKTYLNGLDNQYINSSGCSWSNTQIKVIVPSYVLDGYENIVGYSKVNGGAGTGNFMVMTAQENFASSTQSLQIPYSITNREKNGNIKKVYLARKSCNADFLFALDAFFRQFPSFVTSMVPIIDAALNKLSTLTGLTLKLDKKANGTPYYSDEDYPNFGMKYFIEPKFDGVMSAIINTDEIIFGSNAYLYGLTSTRIGIHVSPTQFTWNFQTTGTIGLWQVSFYEAFIHELGHLLMVSHVIDSTDLMHYALPNKTYSIRPPTSSSKVVQATLQNKAESQAKITVPNSKNIYPVGGSGSLGSLKATFSVKHETNNDRNGHIITTPSGGIAPYSFHWTGGGINTHAKDIYDLKAGTYSLLLSDNAGCSNNYSVTVLQQLIHKPVDARRVEPDGKNGIITEGNEKQNENEINIYDNNYLSINETNKEIRLLPNPNSGFFTVSNIDNATIYLYNTLGAYIKTFEHISNNETINISHLPSGIYFLKIIDGNTIKNEKLVLNK